MKSRFFFLITIYSICFVSCKSATSKKDDVANCNQKCTLFFRAPQEEITLSVYKSVDNTYNYYYIHDELKVTPNGVPVTQRTITQTILTHPHYPSMQCISDALDNWKIKHVALQLTLEQLRVLNVPINRKGHKASAKGAG